MERTVEEIKVTLTEFKLEINGLRISENLEITSLKTLEVLIRDYFEEDIQNMPEDDWLSKEDYEEALEECIDEMVSCFEYSEDEEFSYANCDFNFKIHVKKLLKKDK